MNHTKPSIVLCHGIWADGWCFNKIIPLADGYETIAVQYGFDTHDADVAQVKRALCGVGSPSILVGHSPSVRRRDKMWREGTGAEEGFGRRRRPIPPFRSAMWRRRGGHDGAAHIQHSHNNNTGRWSSIAS